MVVQRKVKAKVVLLLSGGTKSLDLLKRLKSEGKHVIVPVVVYYGHGSPEPEINKAIRIGRRTNSKEFKFIVYHLPEAGRVSQEAKEQMLLGLGRIIAEAVGASKVLMGGRAQFWIPKRAS